MSYYLLRDDFENIGLRMGMLEGTAMDDAYAEFATFNGSVSEFFTKTQKTQPHRFAAPKIDAAGNPVLYNIDAQARYTLEHGEAATRALLGSEGLTLGQIRAPAKETSGRKAARDNPWSKEGWNVTTQSRLVKTLGTIKAGEIAEAAGCKLGSTKPNPAYN